MIRYPNILFILISLILLSSPAAIQARATLTGELHSLYEFRGLSRSTIANNNTQTSSAPSVRAGGDFDSETGMYANAYLSSVAIGLERNIAAGYGLDFEDWGLTIGAQLFSYTSSKFANNMFEANIATRLAFFTLNVDLGQQEKGRNNSSANYGHVALNAKVRNFQFTVGKNTVASPMATNQYLKISYDHDVFGAAIATIAYVYNETDNIAASDQLLLLKISRTIDFDFIFQE